MDCKCLNCGMSESSELRSLLGLHNLAFGSCPLQPSRLFDFRTARNQPVASLRMRMGLRTLEAVALL